MRVITTYGLGTAAGGYPRNGTPLDVTLDAPHLGQPVVALAWGREAFPLSTWPVIRVLSVSGVGLISNVRFRPSWTSARYETVTPHPPDETIFALDLKDGFIESTSLNRLPNVAALSVVTWLDRWAPERGQYWPTVAEALAAWDETESSLAGTSGGISASAVLDLTTGRLLRFSLTVPPPAGTVFHFSAP